MHKIDLLKLRYPGQYAAFGNLDGQVFANPSKDRAWIKAVASGVSHPIVIYCPRLRQNLLSEIASIESILGRIRNLKDATNDKWPSLTFEKLNKVEKDLAELCDAFVRNSLTQEEHQALGQLDHGTS